MTAANTVTSVKCGCPSALFVGREFVVEGKLDGAAGDRLAQFQASTSPPNPDAKWVMNSPLVASPKSEGYKRLLAGYADFRRVFPTLICFPRIRPDDEVVCLKMFHREDRRA